MTSPDEAVDEIRAQQTHNLFCPKCKSNITTSTQLFVRGYETYPYNKKIFVLSFPRNLEALNSASRFRLALVLLLLITIVMWSTLSPSPVIDPPFPLLSSSTPSPSDPLSILLPSGSFIYQHLPPPALQTPVTMPGTHSDPPSNMIPPGSHQDLPSSLSLLNSFSPLSPQNNLNTHFMSGPPSHMFSPSPSDPSSNLSPSSSCLDPRSPSYLPAPQTPSTLHDTHSDPPSHMTPQGSHQDLPSSLSLLNSFSPPSPQDNYTPLSLLGPPPHMSFPSPSDPSSTLSSSSSILDPHSSYPLASQPPSTLHDTHSDPTSHMTRPCSHQDLPSTLSPINVFSPPSTEDKHTPLSLPGQPPHISSPSPSYQFSTLSPSSSILDPHSPLSPPFPQPPSTLHDTHSEPPSHMTPPASHQNLASTLSHLNMFSPPSPQDNYTPLSLLGPPPHMSFPSPSDPSSALSSSSSILDPYSPLSPPFPQPPSTLHDTHSDPASHMTPPGLHQDLPSTLSPINVFSPPSTEDKHTPLSLPGQPPHISSPSPSYQFSTLSPSNSILDPHSPLSPPFPQPPSTLHDTHSEPPSHMTPPGSHQDLASTLSPVNLFSPPSTEDKHIPLSLPGPPPHMSSSSPADPFSTLSPSSSFLNPCSASSPPALQTPPTPHSTHSDPPSHMIPLGLHEDLSSSLSSVNPFSPPSPQDNHTPLSLLGPPPHMSFPSPSDPSSNFLQSRLLLDQCSPSSTPAPQRPSIPHDTHSNTPSHLTPPGSHINLSSSLSLVNMFSPPSSQDNHTPLSMPGPPSHVSSPSPSRSPPSPLSQSDLPSPLSPPIHPPFFSPPVLAPLPLRLGKSSSLSLLSLLLLRFIPPPVVSSPLSPLIKSSSPSPLSSMHPPLSPSDPSSPLSLPVSSTSPSRPTQSFPTCTPSLLPLLGMLSRLPPARPHLIDKIGYFFSWLINFLNIKYLSIITSLFLPVLALQWRSRSPNIKDYLKNYIVVSIQKILPTELDIVKSIVYGGLIQSITSLGVVSCAAAFGTSTVNVLALCIANLFTGLILIIDKLYGLITNQPRFHSANNDDHVTNLEGEALYKELLGNKGNVKLHCVVVVVSFIFFGLIPPLFYGFSFKITDKGLFKAAIVLAASLVCVISLSFAKAYAFGMKKRWTVPVYTGMAIGASAFSFIASQFLNDLLEKYDFHELASDYRKG